MSESENVSVSPVSVQTSLLDALTAGGVPVEIATTLCNEPDYLTNAQTPEERSGIVEQVTSVLLTLDAVAYDNEPPVLDGREIVLLGVLRDYALMTSVYTRLQPLSDHVRHEVLAAALYLKDLNRLK
jgi:hypothetical protein